jgi:hypothetical protein
MITTSEWQGLIREERSEGQVYAPAKPAFPPSLAVKPLENCELMNKNII